MRLTWNAGTKPPFAVTGLLDKAATLDTDDEALLMLLLRRMSPGVRVKVTTRLDSDGFFGLWFPSPAVEVTIVMGSGNDIYFNTLPLADVTSITILAMATGGAANT